MAVSLSSDLSWGEDLFNLSPAPASPPSQRHHCQTSPAPQTRGRIGEEERGKRWSGWSQFTFHSPLKYYNTMHKILKSKLTNKIFGQQVEATVDLWCFLGKTVDFTSKLSVITFYSGAKAWKLLSKAVFESICLVLFWFFLWILTYVHKLWIKSPKAGANKWYSSVL